MACSEQFTIDSSKVQTILNLDSSVNVSVFVDMAGSVVSHLLANCAAGQWDDLGASRIGNWLAAHFYAVVNPTEAMITSQSANGASHSVAIGQAGKGFESTPYGKNALAMDTTGCLRQYDEETRSKPVRLFWGGKVGDSRREDRLDGEVVV